jgi:hypothetical protein
VIDEELRAPAEEVRQRGVALVGFESVFLVDADPRQFLASPRQLVATPRELLLRAEQLEPRCQPFFSVPVMCFVIVLLSLGCRSSGYAG